MSEEKAPVFPVELIAVKDIYPSSNNNRPYDKDAIESLAKSILSVGLLQAVTVRPRPEKGKGEFELLVGERRFRAFQLNKAAQIPAIVRKANDSEAIEIMVTENLQREDLPLLVQADQINRLVKLGKPLSEIAGALGKTISFVARRAKLVDLSPKWVKEVNKKDGEEKFSPANLEIIARLPQEIQNAIPEHIVYNNSAAELSRRVNDEYLMKLSSAPWKMDAVLTTSSKKVLVSCALCPKRSSHQVELFSDMMKDGKVTDRCLDRGCWNAKAEIFLVAKYEELKKEQGKDVAIVDNSEYGNEVLPDDHALKQGAVERYTYDRAKKGEKGAVPALVIGGEGFGTETWIKPRAGVKRIKGGTKTLEEKKKALEKRRTIRFTGHVQEELVRIFKTPSLISSVKGKELVELAIRLVTRFGAEHLGPEINEHEYCDPFDVKAKTGDSVDDLVRCVLPKIWKELVGTQSQTDPDRKEPVQVCRWFGIDFDKLIKQTEEEIPVPKSWAEVKKVPKKEKKGK